MELAATEVAQQPDEVPKRARAADGIARLRVDDGDAECRGRLEGDVFHTDARSPDHAQLRGALEQLFGDAGGMRPTNAS